MAGELIERAAGRTDILVGRDSSATIPRGEAREEIMHQAQRRTLIRGLLMAVTLLAVVGLASKPCHASVMPPARPSLHDVSSISLSFSPELQ